MIAEMIKKQTDRTLAWTYAYMERNDTPPTLRMVKVFEAIAYKFMPFMLKIGTYVSLLYILKLLMNRYGFEIAVLAALAMLVLKDSGHSASRGGG